MIKDPKVSMALAGWVTKWQNDPARKNPYRVKSGQLLRIWVSPSLPGSPIHGTYVVDPDGNVILGPDYGKVPVAGSTIDQAVAAIRKHLVGFVKEPQVWVTPGGWEKDWQKFGEDEARLPANSPSAQYQKTIQEARKIRAKARSAELDAQRQIERDARRRIERETLRYGGKSFNQWRRELLTELKPDIRAEGLKALSAFGANGYATEATAAIWEMMRGYTSETADTDDSKVLNAGLEAVKKIGPAAVPELRKALKDDNRNARRFAVDALMRLGPDAKAALPDLLEAVQDNDPHVRLQVLFALVRTDHKAKGVVSALIAALYDPARRGHAISLLRELDLEPTTGPEAKEMVPALIAAMGDKNADILTIISLLKPYRTQAREAVPALINILKWKHIEYETIGEVAEILGAIGPAAKDAVPVLDELLQRAKNRGGPEAHPIERVLNDALRKINKK
jgi:HEAT repeat protein